MNRIYLLIVFFIYALNTQSQNLPTIGEIYNFDIGDEFHYQLNITGPPAASRITILSKTMSANGDTVRYDYINESFYSQVESYPEMHLEYVFNTSYGTFEYIDLDSIISNPFAPTDTMCFYDTLFDDDSGNCDTMRYGFHKGCGDFEPILWRTTYALGLGKVESYQFYTAPQAYGYFLYLVYFKKGNTECGTPYVVYESIEEESANNINIYPNPFTDLLRIDNDLSKGIVIQIFDINSRLILQENCNDKEITLQTNYLKPGLYFILIKNTDNSIIHTQKIVKK